MMGGTFARRLRGFFGMAPWALALLIACGDADPNNDPAGQSGRGGAAGASGHAGQSGEPLEALPVIETAEQFAALAGEGAEVKYLAIVDGTPPPTAFGTAACLFQNTAKYPYHLQFLRSLPGYGELSPERYSDYVLRRASRVMWGGTLKLLPGASHPLTGAKGVLAYGVYTGSEPNELFTVADIVEVDRRLKANVPFAAEFLAFMPDGTAQQKAVPPLLDALTAEGVAVLDPLQARPGLSAETYSEGEGYGYLKLVAESGLQNVGPRDVLVIEAAPNDLGLVAGLITARPQSVASHLNLRLREKKIPSAAVANVLENSVLVGLSERLVHLKARGEVVTIEPARLEDAEAFWRVRQPPLGTPASELETSALTPLDAIDARNTATFGTKVANLGELSQLLPAENRVTGFALPFRAYADFMAESDLSDEVDSLLADPRVTTDAAYKRSRLSALRDQIRATALSPSLRDALAAAIFAAYGESGATTRLRFRSSTNAEDLPGVSGAGLYDSRSGCLADDLDEDTLGPSACLTLEDEVYLRDQLDTRQRELEAHPDRTYLNDIIADLEQDLADEKSAYRAVLRVWASLWNERAFDDREYYGIDHLGTFMGIAVHPTFVGERLEAVVVTNLEAGSEEPLYRVVSQVGEVGVVGPSDPTAIAEILTFRRGAADDLEQVTLVQPSSLVEDGESLWSPAALEELGRLLFSVQDHFASSVYPSISPLLLDLEVDVTRDGRTVIKQTRPYTP
jgi:pyruvate, water dikinase